jgi:hypothetical protein
VLGLLQAYKNMGELFEYIDTIETPVIVKDIKREKIYNDVESYKNLIQTRIKLAVHWLLQNFNMKDGLLPTYDVPEKGISLYDKRGFPLVLAGMVFSILGDYVDDNLLRISKNYREKIDKTLKIISEKLSEVIEIQTYIPFKFSEKERSFVNTCLGLQHILKWEEGNCNKSIVENLNREAQRWNHEWQKKQSYRYFTDFDYIDTHQISNYFPFYKATYFRLPLIISLQLRCNVERTTIERRVRELISISGKENEFFYYYEDRGMKEIATSATASAIMVLSEFLSYEEGRINE